MNTFLKKADGSSQDAPAFFRLKFAETGVILSII